MQVLYDTSRVHPLDRYEYYRTSSAREVAPVSVHGRTPGRLHAAMSIAQVDDFEIGQVIWSADSPVATRRTERTIRAYDPDYCRLFLVAEGVLRGEQGGIQVTYRARDMGLYDLSRPFEATHGTARGQLRCVMLSFPRRWLSGAHAEIRPLAGAAVPRSLPLHSPVTRFLVGLVDAADPTADPGLTGVVRECVTGLVRQWLGRPAGIDPLASRSLWLVHLREVVRRELHDPALDPDRIASAANISRRYLHKIFKGAELTPMQLLKRLRLEGCHRDLRDPALAAMPVAEIAVRHGYRRPDQFARDFRELFGVSPSHLRGHRPATATGSPTPCEPGTHAPHSP